MQRSHVRRRCRQSPSATVGGPGSLAAPGRQEETSHPPCVGIVLEPAPEAGADTFLVGASTGRLIGDRGQVCPMTASQAADHGDQGIEMAFAMAGERWKELHQGPFYGSIAVVRVTHGAPPD